MILADTSVWVDHLRRRNRHLAVALDRSEVVCHPFVVGELALGHLKRRREILDLLSRLPAAPVADHTEVLLMAEQSGLVGSGIGWIDAHLLAGARLAGVGLWTLDRRLARAARSMGLLGAE